MILLIILLYAMYTIIVVFKRKIRVRDANREISLMKMDLLSKQAHLQNLIEDSVQWSDKDLAMYDRVLSDSKILKGKLDTGMTVADSKTKRLELGNETVELFETLEKIKTYEDKLFGDGIADKKSGGR